MRSVKENYKKINSFFEFKFQKRNFLLNEFSTHNINEVAKGSVHIIVEDRDCDDLWEVNESIFKIIECASKEKRPVLFKTFSNIFCELADNAIKFNNNKKGYAKLSIKLYSKYILFEMKNEVNNEMQTNLERFICNYKQNDLNKNFLDTIQSNYENRKEASGIGLISLKLNYNLLFRIELIKNKDKVFISVEAKYNL
ncbi:hypothetical protein DID75_00795 [Candidatus Marinamargulisbacteria bacterium SCGC AG-410-N11]|nr:hypothetical protein DID75_00795 [Candidatus Marinamargulisbacteria bacterium SCGC AG-410-N11]